MNNKVYPSDVTVFILSYNRDKYLEMSIKSVLMQSAKGISIIVLDNCSTDNTKNIVLKYFNSGVRFISAEKNIGAIGNIKKAQSLIKTKWVMMFHDDDILHSNYIEESLKAINSIPDIVLCGSAGSVFTNTNSIWKKSYNNKSLISNNQSEFVSVLFKGFPYTFCSVIYRADIFKYLLCEYDLYGKILDRPFVISAAEHGKCVTFIYPHVNIRVHSGQDTCNIINQITENNLENIINLYKSILLKNGLRGKITYYNYALFNVLSLYLYTAKNKKIYLIKYLIKIYKMHILNIFSLIFGIFIILFKIIIKCLKLL